jgi:hypothetical protein
MGLGRRLLPLSLDNDATRVHLYIQPIGERWAAMNVGKPARSLGRMGYEARASVTAEEAESLARAFLGMSEPVNRGRPPVAPQGKSDETVSQAEIEPFVKKTSQNHYGESSTPRVTERGAFFVDAR